MVNDSLPPFVTGPKIMNQSFTTTDSNKFIEMQFHLVTVDYLHFYYCPCNPTIYIEERISNLVNLKYIKEQLEIVNHLEEQPHDMDFLEIGFEQVI
ncbi:hypothetical protein F8M41_015081 [Gigaspora margarita]|uniref:Uncharacterized protein n=1 Tax=Gigaspora margarita TaxID=4874 RepID=A0A8H3WY37_GIGMA|nr:hypothetical protein F8M41_015081 [Gigaspora margarita]